jgi:collagen type VII alpha
LIFVSNIKMALIVGLSAAIIGAATASTVGTLVVRHRAPAAEDEIIYEVGPTGPRGDPGIRGPTGLTSTLTGPAGMAGPTGISSNQTGPTGYTGKTGQTGPTSAAASVMGPTGIAGPAPAGPTGSTGVTGATGFMSSATGIFQYSFVSGGSPMTGTYFKGSGTTYVSTATVANSASSTALQLTIPSAVFSLGTSGIIGRFANITYPIGSTFIITANPNTAGVLDLGTMGPTSPYLPLTATANVPPGATGFFEWTINSPV